MNIIREQHSRYLIVLMIMWFFIMILFMFFASFETPTYAVYCIVPMIIMAAWFYDKLPRFDFSARFKWIITALFLSLLVFTFMNGIKPGTNYTFISDTPYTIKMLYGLVLLLLIALVFLPKETVGKMTSRTLLNSWKYLPYLLLFKVVGINFMVQQGNSFGAAETSLVLKEFGSPHIVYMAHGESKEEIKNSQLAWYLYKSMDDWKKLWLYNTPLGRDRIDYSSLAWANDMPPNLIVYHISEKTELTDRVVEELKKTRPLLLSTPNYLVFGMKRKNKPVDVLAME